MSFGNSHTWKNPLSFTLRQVIYRYLPCDVRRLAVVAGGLRGNPRDATGRYKYPAGVGAVPEAWQQSLKEFVSAETREDKNLSNMFNLRIAVMLVVVLVAIVSVVSAAAIADPRRFGGYHGHGGYGHGYGHGGYGHGGYGHGGYGGVHFGHGHGHGHGLGNLIHGLSHVLGVPHTHYYHH